MATNKHTQKSYEQTRHPIQFSIWLIIIFCIATIGIRSCMQFHAKQKVTPIQHHIQVPKHKVTFFTNKKIIHIATTTLRHSPWKIYTVRKYDNITTIFKRAAICSDDYRNILQLKEAKTILRNIKPGHPVYLLISPKKNKLEKLVYKINDLQYFEVIQASDQFKSKTIKQLLEKKLQQSSFTIKHSLNHAANLAGFSNQFIHRLTKIFTWKVNFKKALRPGDILNVVYEQYYANGKKAKVGKILAAELINHKRNYTAIRYKNKRQHVGYFTPQGHSLRRAFLRAPIKYKRISSKFNSKRVHPILKIVRAHEGVDLAAPSGTPIKATSEGRIVFRSRKGGYGKVVIIKHGRKYSTLYAHMSRYAKKVHLHSRVKTGQIIGYVGCTGLATGPHLHYEFRINGVCHDPMTVKLPNAFSVPRRERIAFKAKAKRMIRLLRNIKHN